MQIDIQAHGFSLTGALRDYTERRLRFALPPETPSVPGDEPTAVFTFPGHAGFTEDGLSGDVKTGVRPQPGITGV